MRWLCHDAGMRLLFALILVTLTISAAGQRPPNVVLILADDLGYADLGCFGAEKIKTPHLDRLAAEGTKFTSFYVAQAVCSASRAALMTGCYANRVGMQGALNHTSKEGIHPDELLLPEMCKAAGYTTGMFGKWHLGTYPMFNPLRHGFDEFLGIPYSNDNSKFHPSLAKEMPPLPFYDGLKVIETDPDQSQFTRRFTERATSFIERNKGRPFFLYLPHVMPHVPIFASDAFRGKSAAGLYGDVVEELDWSVGQILDAIKRCGIERDTLVIFFSDNGPFLSYGNHAGSAKPLREGKLTTFEGGVRVPFIARWPDRVPKGGTCDEPVMEIDLLPTLAALTGAKLPEKKIDGQNVLDLLEGKAGAKSPHEALVFYGGSELQAVRSGEWKLHFPHPYITVDGEPGRDGKPAKFGQMKPKSITQSGVEGIASRHGYRVEKIGLSLFNLKGDPGETRDVAKEQPEIVERLQKLAEPMRKELGDALLKVKGTENRPLGMAP
ncbi:sulfatase [Prosthecobacter sp.]|uniref:sulfatase family protein n=1 Tax=Prosthecobacter sp. TaxID=1965333 RepID=UPI002AB9D9E0|nr:sulfatase [Prosthecobacter sp.]MDZ4404250.1 sulfatase [Prosthecobacter sp.]